MIYKIIILKGDFHISKHFLGKTFFYIETRTKERDN